MTIARPPLFPLLLDLRDKPCLVAGGGATAAKRVRSLLSAGAGVMVVAPEVEGSLRDMVMEGEVAWAQRPFAPEDVEGKFLVVAVTDDPSLNAAIESICRSRGILVCANAPDWRGDALFPSVIRQGELVIAVSTSGGSPSLSRMIREELEAGMDQELPALVSVMSGVRKRLKERGVSPSFQEWRAALDDGICQMMVDGDYRGAEEELLRRLSGAPAENPEIAVWGISHRTACLEAKERLSLEARELERLIKDMKARLGNALVLDTCNRFEVYSFTLPLRLREAVGSMVVPRLAGLEEGRDYECYFLRGESCLRHLVRVVSGLDSMVVGEHQIRHQVRRAARLSESLGALRHPLKGAVQRALHAGRGIAAHLSGYGEERSISGEAVAAARECAGGLEGKAVLVIGSGQAGGIALRLLAKEAVGRLWFMGSHYHRVSRLAEASGATPLLHQDLENVLLEADVVINTSPVPKRTLGEGDLEEIMRARAFRPLIIVDIAVPRGFPEESEGIKGVTLKNLLHLGRVNGHDPGGGVALEEMVERETRSIARWLGERNASPIITRLRREAEDMAREVTREIAVSLGLEDGERDYVEKRIDLLVRRILHGHILLARSGPEREW